eukprot:3750547-Rhodomonas_salina.1
MNLSCPNSEARRLQCLSDAGHGSSQTAYSVFLNSNSASDTLVTRLSSSGWSPVSADHFVYIEQPARYGAAARQLAPAAVEAEVG